MTDNNNSNSATSLPASDSSTSVEQQQHEEEEEVELVELRKIIVAAVNGDPEAIEKYLQTFPKGYRFAPKEHELINHYLRPKIFNKKLPINNILILNIYQHNPKDIADKYNLYEKDGKELFLFTPRDRKYPNGHRPNRAAVGGFWKATGKDKDICENEMSTKVIGHKKTLVFYEGKATKGVKTKWIMHEYRLSDMTPRAKSHPKDMRLDDWILVRLYLKKSSNKQKKGNKNVGSEQEQDDEEEDDDEEEEEEPLNVTPSDLGQNIALPTSVNTLEPGGDHDDRRYNMNVATGNENGQNNQQQIVQYTQDPDPIYHENGQLAIPYNNMVMYPETGLQMPMMGAANHYGHNNSGTPETFVANSYSSGSQQPTGNHHEQNLPAEESFDMMNTGSNFWSLDNPQIQNLDFANLLPLEDCNSNNPPLPHWDNDQMRLPDYNNNLPMPLCYSNNIRPMPPSEEKRLPDNCNPSKEKKLTQKRLRSK